MIPIDKTKQEITLVVGERIRYYRLVKKFSQESLALRANLNPAYLGQIERGLKCPTVDTLYKISNALEIPLPDLVRVEQSFNDYPNAVNPLNDLITQIPQGKAEEVSDIFGKILKLLV